MLDLLKNIVVAQRTHTIYIKTISHFDRAVENGIFFYYSSDKFIGT